MNKGKLITKIREFVFIQGLLTNQIQKGFTLVELLIVIGILALLASVVIVALNPIQSLAKTRDAGRLSTIAQIGHSLESYATSVGTGKYVDPAAACAGSGLTWLNCLTAVTGSGDLNGVPSAVNNSLTALCAGPASATVGVQNGWCYKVTGATGIGPVIAYSRLEAASNRSKCPTPATDLAWAVYSSADGKTGIVCTSSVGGEGALTTGAQTFR